MYNTNANKIGPLGTFFFPLPLGLLRDKLPRGWLNFESLAHHMFMNKHASHCQRNIANWWRLAASAALAESKRQCQLCWFALHGDVSYNAGLVACWDHALTLSASHAVTKIHFCFYWLLSPCDFLQRINTKSMHSASSLHYSRSYHVSTSCSLNKFIMSAMRGSYYNMFCKWVKGKIKKKGEGWRAGGSCCFMPREKIKADEQVWAHRRPHLK